MLEKQIWPLDRRTCQLYDRGEEKIWAYVLKKSVRDCNEPSLAPCFMASSVSGNFPT